MGMAIVGGVFDISRYAPLPSDVPALLLLVAMLVAVLTRGGGNGGGKCEAA